MGELVRFPGAQVDWSHFDDFEWTPEILSDYAARAAALVRRYGGHDPLGVLPSWPRGVCQDCGRVENRYRLGRRLLCATDAGHRLRVREDVAA